MDPLAFRSIILLQKLHAHWHVCGWHLSVGRRELLGQYQSSNLVNGPISMLLAKYTALPGEGEGMSVYFTMEQTDWSV